jgi:hypothetical protein
MPYHRVCRAIASKNVNCVWINWKNNPEDIVCKHSYPHFCHMLQAILIFSGDTSDQIKEDEVMKDNSDGNTEK